MFEAMRGRELDLIAGVVRVAVEYLDLAIGCATEDAGTR